MMRSCEIPNCPALATMPARYCAIHTAMPREERDADFARAKLQAGTPMRRVVVSNVDYERDKP